MGKEKNATHLSLTISSILIEILRRTTTVNYKPNGFLIYNPKTIICEAQAKKLNIPKESEKIVRRIANGCSSEKEHKVNALAPRAEEGRDNLR